MEARQQISKSRVLKVESGESWESFMAQAKSQGSPVFVHFSASWCVPSLAMNSYVEELAMNYQDILFLLVDVDEVKHELRDARTSGAATELHKLRDPRTVGAVAKFRWADEVHPKFRREVASKMEVKAMPTFIIIKDGTPVDKMVGANPEEIKKRIEALVHQSI